MTFAQKLIPGGMTRAAGRTTTVAASSARQADRNPIPFVLTTTCGDIARAHNTSVDRIKQLNNLQSNRIVVGQVLRLR